MTTTKVEIQVAPAPPSDEIVAAHAAFALIPAAEVREALLTRRPVPKVDEGLVARAIQDRLMATTDIDEVMDPLSRQTTERLMETPFTLRSALFMPSDIEDAADAVYVVLDVVDDHGLPHLFSTGAGGVIRQVFALIEAGKLPRRCKLIEVGKDTANRSRPLYLQDVK